MTTVSSNNEKKTCKSKKQGERTEKEKDRLKALNELGNI